jgi:hypothetical protein
MAKLSILVITPREEFSVPLLPNCGSGGRLHVILGLSGSVIPVRVKMIVV